MRQVEGIRSKKNANILGRINSAKKIITILEKNKASFGGIFKNKN